MYEVRILEAAIRDLARLDRQVARRVLERIRWLAANMGEIKPIPLTGDLAGLFKLRIGDYRVIYEIVRSDQMIVIHVIGHRSDVYR